MPALEGGQRLGHLAAVRPRLPRPRLALLDGHEVHEPAAGYEIVHEVTARAHPVVRRDLEPEMLEAICGHEAAIGGAAGEARLLRSEEACPHRGMDPVGAHEHTGSGTRAVGERELDVITLILEAGEAVVEL